MFLNKFITILIFCIYFEYGLSATTINPLNDHVTEVVSYTTELNTEQDEDIQSLFDKYEKSFITNASKITIDEKFNEDNVTDNVHSSTDHVIATVQNIVGKFQANVENNEDFPIEILDDSNTNYKDLALIHHEELSFGHPEYVENLEPKHITANTTDMNVATKKTESKSLEDTEKEYMQKSTTSHYSSIETTTHITDLHKSDETPNAGIIINENNSTFVRPNIFSNMASIIRNAIGTLIKRRYTGRNFNDLSDKYNNEEEIMLNDATTVETLLIEADQLAGKSEEELQAFKYADDKLKTIESDSNQVHLKPTTTDYDGIDQKLNTMETTIDYETTSIANSFVFKKDEEYFEMKTVQPATIIKTEEKKLNIYRDFDEIQFITEKHEETKNEFQSSEIPKINQVHSSIDFNNLKEEKYTKIDTYQPTTTIKTEEKDTQSSFDEIQITTEKQEEIKKEYLVTENSEKLQETNNTVHLSFAVIFPKEEEKDVEIESHQPVSPIKTDEEDIYIKSDIEETQFVTEMHKDIKDAFYTTEIPEQIQVNNTKISSTFDFIIPNHEESHIKENTYQPTSTIKSDEKDLNINSYLKETEIVIKKHEILTPEISEKVQEKKNETPSFFDFIVPKVEEKHIAMVINQPTSRNKTEEQNLFIRPDFNESQFVTDKQEGIKDEHLVVTPKLPEKSQDINLDIGSKHDEKHNKVKTYQLTLPIKTEEKNLYNKIKPDFDETEFVTEKYNETKKEFVVTEVTEKPQEKNISTNQISEMEHYYKTTTIETKDATENTEVVKDKSLATIVSEKTDEKVSDVSSSFNIVFPKEDEEDEKYFEMKTYNPTTTIKSEVNIPYISPRIKETQFFTIKEEEDITDELVAVKVPEKSITQQESIIKNTENLNVSHTTDNTEEKVHFETTDYHSTTVLNSGQENLFKKPVLQEIDYVTDKKQEFKDHFNITEVSEKSDVNNNFHREHHSNTLLIDPKEIEITNKYVDKVATTVIPELFTILSEDHFEEKIITNNEFKPEEKIDMELHVISEENYQVPDIKENKSNYHEIKTTDQKSSVDSKHLNIFDIISGNEGTIYRNAIHDDSSMSMSQIYEQSTEYYNNIHRMSDAPTTEKLPLTSSSSSSSSESISLENTNDTDAYILQSVTVKGVTIWELTAKPIHREYEDIKSELKKIFDADYNPELEKSVANENVIAETIKLGDKSYRDARTLGQIQESDFIEEQDTLRDITAAAEMDLKRNEALHTVTKKDGVDEIRVNNFEDIGKLINFENADVIDEIIYKNIAKESEHHLITDQIHEVTETTISHTEGEITNAQETDVNNNINFNNSSAVEEYDDPVTTKDVFKTIVDAVELSTDVTKIIENFHDVMDKNSAILEASNQIVSSKKTREMFEFGVDNAIAQEITNNTNNISNDSDFVEYIIIGMCSLVALSVVLTALFVAIQKARAYNILDFTPV